ncbi:major capsid protein [Flagellatimonas centrodinii]|uniref:major capsid protein n=1 Tax=Flagellatimonas centrodinii TaxID=2806210 RepID=UPI001FF81938|nr:major capsid protein [Flagellatimonas centrodinii]ULQ45966.1 major capsid protein [Flagellatimonas centrodinii]
MNLDVFNATSGAFSMRALTASINAMPFVPGQIGRLGLFNERGISTTQISLERRDGQIYLVPAADRGAPAKQNQKNGRKLVPINAVHLPVEDVLQADEVQNVRAFGSESELLGVQEKVNEKLETMSMSLEATLEHHRMGALKGIVLDADGASPLYNLFTLFGINQPAEVDYDLDAASPAAGAVRKKINATIRGIEDALGSATYTSIHCYCDSAFFDALVSHVECVAAYERWQNGQALRERSARRTFHYAGIDFEEYRGSVGGVPFIGAGKAQFFPVGVQRLFETVYAPANWMETVNTMGLPKYVKATPDKKGRWVELDAQSNPVTYCTRPEVLFRAKMT